LKGGDLERLRHEDQLYADTTGHPEPARMSTGATTALPDAILLVDIEGNIASADPSFETAFGYDRTEVIGMPIGHLLPEMACAGDAAVQESRAAEQAAPATAQCGTFLARHKTGTAFAALLQTAYLNLPQGRYQINAIFRLPT
jgi:PAS domain S-box-containing protein